MSIKIGLDCGHGLKTAGKQTPNGIKEWEINDAVRDKVVAKLSEYDCEIMHTDNNEGNVDESLSYRLNAYLNAKVDAFASIHHNAFKGIFGTHTGVEVYVDINATDDDMRLAECIYKRLVEYTGLKGRGIKKVNFYVINQNKVPAVLIEGGFMDGKHDYEVITSEAGQDAYARAVAEGLVEFLGLTVKTPLVEAAKKSNEEIAREVIAGWWGNGSARKTNLTKAGYDYSAVQAIVNKLVKGESVAPTAPAKKSNEEIAREVIAGKWGNGAARKQRLKEAGYNASAIQALVNKMLK